MLVCNVSMRAPRRAIAVDLAEVAVALDATTTGFVVFATLVDDPASVGDFVDAFTGEIMVEAATVTDTVDAGLAYSAAMVEAASAADTDDATITAGGGAWTPISLTTLKGWYKADTLTGADNSNVTSWPDSSGLGNDATPHSGLSWGGQLQTAEQNSLNVVQTGTGGACFDLPNLLSGASACAAVFVAKTSTTGHGGPLMIGTESTFGEVHYPYSDNHIYDSFCSTTRKDTGAVTGLTSWHIGSFHSAASNYKYFKNGVQTYSTTTNTVGIRTAPILGSSATPSIYYYDGMIGEMVIVNEFLSDSDRQKIEGYLAWKWGLAGSLDVSHPYKSAPP